MMAQKFKRVFWIVLDGLGVGELPDAAAFGDQGSNTLGNLARQFVAQKGRALEIPNLRRMGFGGLASLPEPAGAPLPGLCLAAKARELSRAKDTTSGHWEMVGLVVDVPFQVYPHGFTPEVLARWCRENGLPGWLGNKPASGTEILKELGEEHVRTGKPIVYTSGDSVWQVAAHEDSFGVERLNAICKSARKICDELKIGRVISRPFVGDPSKGIPFTRTYNRKDFAQLPFKKTYLDALVDNGVATLGVGKISNIFAAQGIQKNIDTKGNRDGLRVVGETVDTVQAGLIFCNLIDFDMLYGHRRDVVGFGAALEEFDVFLTTFLPKLSPDDLVVLTADHGNDPTYGGTDHTREHTPFVTFLPGRPPELRMLTERTTFADSGATVAAALLGTQRADWPAYCRELAGQSVLPS